MNTSEEAVELLKIGLEPNPERGCLRYAWITWSGEDVFADTFWWYVTAPRRSHRTRELMLWNASNFPDENDVERFSTERIENALVSSWAEVRALLDQWTSDYPLFLSEADLDGPTKQLFSEKVPSWGHSAPV